MIIVDRNKLPQVPKDIAVCPICSRAIIIDVDEWETETGRVTDGGLHIDCESQPDFDSPDFESWINEHWSMPYVDWLPVEHKVYRWFDNNYRLNVGGLND